MGEEVAGGSREHPYEIELPFILRDIIYFYGNETNDHHYWFIQELVSRDAYTIRKTPLE